MKRILIFLFLNVFSLYCFSQNDMLNLTETQIEQTTKLVNHWLEEIFKADDVDELMKISEVPFALDRKKMIKDRVELKKIYNIIFERKGKRKIPHYTVEILAYTDEIINGYIPVSIVKVRILMTRDSGKDSALVSVLLKDNQYKIIGFTD